MPEDHVNQPLLGSTYPPHHKSTLSPPIRSYLRRFLFPIILLVLLIITALGGMSFRSKASAAIWGNGDYDVGYAEEGLDDAVGSLGGLDEKEGWRKESSGKDALLGNVVSGNEKQGTALPIMSQELKDTLADEEAYEPLREESIEDEQSDEEDSGLVVAGKAAEDDEEVLPVCKRTLSYSFYGEHYRFPLFDR